MKARWLWGAACLLLVGCVGPFKSEPIADRVAAVRETRTLVLHVQEEVTSVSGLSPVRKDNVDKALAKALAELTEADDLLSLSPSGASPYDRVDALVEAARTRAQVVQRLIE